MEYNKLRRIFFSFLIICGLPGWAQMSGTYSVPATFTSLAAAINSVSATTPLGPITIEIAAGYIEKAPFGGYTLTAKGSAATPITFKKNGSGPNPLLIAFSGGTNTPATNFQDGVWQLKGSDYITIDGIDILDTNSFNPATMEYGYGLMRASSSGTNGCQYNTIQNCTITLKRINNTYSSGYNLSKDGSIGILSIANDPSSFTWAASIYSVSGTNSFNKFYNNTIQNCNIGIALLGPVQYYFDQFNDIGGTSPAKGNRIINYGGAPSATSKAAGIITCGQEDLNISYNVIDNNTGLGIDHPQCLFGIKSFVPNFTNTKIQSNTVTVHGGGTTHSVVAILSDYDYGGLPTPSGTLEVENNLVTNCSYSTATSGDFYGIFNRSLAQNISLSKNILSNNSSACTSGVYCNVYTNAGLNWSTTNVFTVGANNNLISNISLTSGSTSVDFNGIIVAASSNSLYTYSASINSNSIQSVNYAGAANGPFNFISGYGGSIVMPLKFLRIQNNHVLGLNIPTTGAVSLITAGYNVDNVLVTGNKIVSFTKSVSGNSVTGYYDFISSPTATTNISGNNFSNVTLTGATNYTGIQLSPPTPTVRTVFINTNTISTISTGTAGSTFGILVNSFDTLSVINSNFISNINSGMIRGITGTGKRQLTVHSNTINTLTGSNTVYGLNVMSGGQNLIYKNKIYDLQSNSSFGGVYGILYNMSAPVKIYNNLIGDLRTPFANNITAISGIDMDVTTLGSTYAYEVYHNSIYINASSTGTNFGTSGISHTAMSMSDGNLILKNNLIVNTSTANGTGIVSALRRTSSNLPNYSTTSNNNLFYVNGPWPKYREYDDGGPWTSYTAVLANISPREYNSVKELPPFISTVGSNTNFLNLNTTIPTQAESGGIPVAGITDDYIGTIRNSNPDIGAWEGNFTLADSAKPNIIGIAKADGMCNLSSITVTANIVDASGVASGSLAPRCYYKINSGPYTSVQGNLISGNFNNGNWIFMPTYSANVGDVLSYYVCSQDIISSPHIASMPIIGFTATSVNSVLTPPSTPYTMTIIGVLNGTYSVGVGGNFTTLTSAANAYNTWCLTGPVTFMLTDPNYSTSETFPITFSNNPTATTTNSLLIRPNTSQNSTITVSGSTTGLRFVNARCIHLNGINSGGSSLVLSNPTATAAIHIASTPGGGNKRLEFHNLIINGRGTNPDNYAIISGSLTTIPGMSAGDNNDSITIANNIILRAHYGIVVGGGGTLRESDNWIIRNNSIGPVTNGTDNLGATGIRLFSTNSSTLSNNIIRNITTYDNTYIAGIYVSFCNGLSVTQNTLTAISSSATTGYTNSISGINVSVSTSNSTFDHNLISGIVNSPLSGGARGICLQTNLTNSNIKVNNNMISDISCAAGTPSALWPIGIAVEQVTGGVYVENNSVNLFGTHSGTNTTSFSSAYLLSTTFGTVLRNNILSNTYYNSSSINSTRYAVCSTVAATSFSVIDHNDYYVGSGPGNAVLGYISLTNQTSLAAIQSSFGGNVNSKNIVPVFVSPTDLHLVPSSNASIDDAGTPVPGITTDIDLQTRNPITPDIGADEFYSIPCSTVSGVTQSATTVNGCAGQSFTLNSVGATGYGINYQWQVSSSPGGPYSNVSGATTLNYSTNTLPTGVYYYVLQITCTASSLTAISNEATVTINPLPTINITSTNSLVCYGQTVVLTANGASTYTWNTTAVSNSISLTPTVTTNYFVNGTDMNGCLNSAAFTQSVAICAELKEISSSSVEFKVYPNPNNGSFIILVNNAEKNIVSELYNVFGQLIFRKQLEEIATEISINEESSGIYFLRLSVNGTVVNTSRLIKN